MFGWLLKCKGCVQKFEFLNFLNFFLNYDIIVVKLSPIWSDFLFLLHLQARTKDKVVISK